VLALGFGGLIFGAVGCHGGRPLARPAAGQMNGHPGATRRAALDASAVFLRIRLGMTRAQVETLAGKPMSGDLSSARASRYSQTVWYLQPPKIGPSQSPYAPGTIGVVYCQGKVLAKQLNPQFQTASPIRRRCVSGTPQDPKAGTGKPTAQFNLNALRGPMPETTVTAVLQKNLGRITRCYQQAKSHQRGLAGPLALVFEIQPSGAVQRLGLGRGASKTSYRLIVCVLSTIKQWRFGRRTNPKTVSVSVLFTFGRLRTPAAGSVKGAGDAGGGRSAGCLEDAVNWCAFTARQSQLHSCLIGLKATDPQLRTVRTTVTLTFDKAGKVKDVRVDLPPLLASNPAWRQVQGCLVSRIKRWKWPRITRGRRVVLRQTFTFQIP